MTDSAQPFAAKKFLEINGRRMAYIDEGEGAPIVFAHGNPTSSGFAQKVFHGGAFYGQIGAFWSRKTTRMRPESPY